MEASAREAPPSAVICHEVGELVAQALPALDDAPGGIMRGFGSRRLTTRAGAYVGQEARPSFGVFGRQGARPTSTLNEAGGY